LIELDYVFSYCFYMLPKGKKNSGGRPPKFPEPRYPVTMTLPKRILDQLAEIDPDRTRAVVKVTEAVAGTGSGRFKPVELITMAPGKSLIIIGPSQVLRKIPWLKMIEITPARYLLTIPSGMSIETLEVTLRDLILNPELQEKSRDYAILHELLNLIGHQRRAQRLSKEEILIINSDS
jgi:hypothetical protein